MTQGGKTSLTAIVAGATGLVGQEIVRQLSASPRYSKIIILVRRDTNLSALPKVVAQPFPASDEILKADQVYCCLGTTIKKAGSREAFRHVDYELVMQLASCAKKGGVPRMAVVTAIGTSLSSPFFYSRVKAAVERDLKAMKFPQLDIYQPSLLLGDRTEFRLGEKIGELFAKALDPFLIGSFRTYAAIEARELAKHMIEQTNSPDLSVVQVKS